MTIENKYFLVTGSSSGIGLNICEMLLEKNALIIGLDKNTTSLKHKNYTHIITDVSNDNSIKSSIDNVMQCYKKLDGIINVAGISGANQCLENTSPSEFKRIVETHLFGTYAVCHYALPYLKKSNNGIIINFSSLFALRSAPRFIAYNAAKAAIISLTETMALELAPNIRVNSIAPGFINTPMTQSNPKYTSMLKMVEDTYPLKQPGTTTQIADAVLFLINNDFITGETLKITGGAHL